MLNRLRGLALPDWTATQEDIRRPWTHLLGLLTASMVITSGWMMQYAKDGEAVPLAGSLAILAIYFVVVPGLALSERTEVLFDAVRLSWRTVVFGFLLFVVAYWTTAGEPSAFANVQSMATFAIVFTGLYGVTVLGVLWVVQYARKGTSGVESEPL